MHRYDLLTCKRATSGSTRPCNQVLIESAIPSRDGQVVGLFLGSDPVPEV